MNYKTFLFLITLLTACKSENKSPQQSQQLSDTIYGIDSTSIVKPIEDKIIRNYTIVPKKQFGDITSATDEAGLKRISISLSVLGKITVWTRPLSSRMTFESP